MDWGSFREFTRRYIAVILLTGFLFAYGCTSARTGDPTQSEVIALSYSSDMIIVAYPHALYRIDNLEREWTSIPLPASVRRITAVATPANKAGRIYIAAPALGVLRSEDNGKTWSAHNAGLPSKEITVLTHHATQSDTLYALIAEVGIFRSENTGQSWQLMDGGPEEMTSAFIHSDMPGVCRQVGSSWGQRQALAAQWTASLCGVLPGNSQMKSTD